MHWLWLAWAFQKRTLWQSSRRRRKKRTYYEVKTGIRSLQTGRDNGGNKNYWQVLHQYSGLFNTYINFILVKEW
jgi:hypothetical protein